MVHTGNQNTQTRPTHRDAGQREPLGHVGHVVPGGDFGLVVAEERAQRRGLEPRVVVVPRPQRLANGPEPSQRAESESDGKGGDENDRVVHHSRVRGGGAVDGVVDEENADHAVVARVVLLAAQRLEEAPRDGGQEELGELL